MKRALIFVLAIAAVMFVVGSAFAFNDTCADSYQHTAAGSTKDSRCTIHCGNNNPAPLQPDGIKAYANQTANGAELEACSDQGPGNQHGRLVVVVDQSKGVRVVLDSDENQQVGSNAGYEIIQVGTNGVVGWYCNKPSTTTGADGYEQPWSNPGPDQAQDCATQIL